MGYYSDEGILHINGRIDNQIKVNGHRIETGEVESIINQIPGVKNSAVIPYKNDGKVMGLVAYVEKGGENINSTTEVDDSFGDNLLKKAKKCYEHIDLADFNNWKKYSELTALADILNCFNKAGLFLDKNLGHTLLEIHEAIAETDKYKRSVTRMIHALSREGFLHKEADIYYLTRNADILLERKKLWEQFEYYESIIKYSRKYFAYQKKAGNSILEQLREEINALNLFFPEGGTDVALSAYKDNLINEALNKVISFLVNESIQLKKKVKILEVGAGVGGTTIPVITNLVHHDITYCFTDISKFFLNNARKNFEDYDFMEYKLFDINMNFEEQGFYEDSYDLIICANVLHNSMDIADRVIYIKEGEILQDITIDEFKKLSTNTLEKMGLRSRKISFDNIQTPVIESQDYIHFKDFSFAYEKEKNMDIKSLMIPCGSVVAIIGKNGAGKSTFGRCMCGLEKKVKGTMTFYGKELNWKERIKNCYLVMQDVNHQLFTESVLEEILLSMENYADNESVKKANAIKILKALNLEKFQEVHPMSLSGGQKQRVSVACALASDKKILVYDEPTSGLDYTRMLDVAEAIKSMQKRGRTQFVITHDPELIEKCCDYVMFMDKGGVIDVGTIEEERLHRIKKFFRV